jgi:predicted porin
MKNRPARATLKKSLLSLAALVASGALCGQAVAETSMSIYGRIVGGIDYQSNVAKADGTAGSLWRGAGNQWGTGMFGFKGTEELGGGLKALFLLESGFSTPQGATNSAALFNRRAYVGFSGSAGNLKLGKNLFISNDVWFLDPTGQQFMGTATLVRGRNWPGADNVIEYQTPTWSGFNAIVQTGLGEQPGSFSNLRKDGISLLYSKAGLELRGIYTQVRDAAGRYTSIFETSKEWILGGAYTLDRLKLFAAYERLSAPDAAAGAPDRANHYWIGANYNVTPALVVIGAGFHINANNGGGHANLFMLGTNYSLSKRTLLYVAVGNVRNGATANFSVEATNNNPLPGQNQTGAYLGVAHTF